MRETDGSRVSATVRLSMLNPRPLNKPATRASTPNSFSTKTEMVWRMGSDHDGGAAHKTADRAVACGRRAAAGAGVAASGAVAPEDLHDAVLAREFDLLNPLLLEILVRSQEVFVLQRRQLLFQVQVLL